MFCKNCGTQIPDESVFCSVCGTRQEQMVQQPVQMQQVQQPIQPENEEQEVLTPEEAELAKKRKYLKIAGVVIALGIGFAVMVDGVAGQDVPFGTKASAFLGNADAQYEIAKAYQTDRENNDKYIEWLEKAADGGNVEAQYDLGMHYNSKKMISWMKGENDNKNIKETIKWITKAAENGHAKAQVYLGDLYSDSTWVTKDMDVAIKWYKKADEHGHIMAHYMLESF